MNARPATCVFNFATTARQRTGQSTAAAHNTTHTHSTQLHPVPYTSNHFPSGTSAALGLDTISTTLSAAVGWRRAAMSTSATCSRQQPQRRQQQQHQLNQCKPHTVPAVWHAVAKGAPPKPAAPLSIPDAKGTLTVSLLIALPGSVSSPNKVSSPDVIRRPTSPGASSLRPPGRTMVYRSPDARKYCSATCTGQGAAVHV